MRATQIKTDAIEINGGKANAIPNMNKHIYKKLNKSIETPESTRIRVKLSNIIIRIRVAFLMTAKNI